MAPLVDVVVVGGIFREISMVDGQPRMDVAGSGVTASVIAARLGARTALVSYVGEEDDQSLRAILGMAGVIGESVIVLPGASGTFVFPNEEDPSTPWPLFRPAEATPSSHVVVPAARIYVVFGLPESDPIAEGWLDEMPTKSTILWDRQGWLSRARDWHSVLQIRADRKIYLANRGEVTVDLCVAGVRDEISKLPPVGFDAAVVKEGSKGCLVFRRTERGTERLIVGGYPIETRRTVGSGDAFAGGLAASLSQGADLVRGVAVGNAVAASFLSVGRDALAGALINKAESLLVD